MANSNSRICIVSSEFLQSMEHNSIPTASEISDVYTVAMQDCTGIVVSKEVILGKHAINCAKFLTKIVEETNENKLSLSR